MNWKNIAIYELFFLSMLSQTDVIHITMVVPVSSLFLNVKNLYVCQIII